MHTVSLSLVDVWEGALDPRFGKQVPEVRREQRWCAKCRMWMWWEDEAAAAAAVVCGGGGGDEDGRMRVRGEIGNKADRQREESDFLPCS